jgi:Domain of Unknown Function (DUF1259)
MFIRKLVEKLSMNNTSQTSGVSLAAAGTLAICLVVLFLMPSSQHYLSAQDEPTKSTTFQESTEKLDCTSLGKTIGGIPVPNGNVCDVVVVRESPQIIGHNGLVMNKFALMNSVLEFMPVQSNSTSPTENSSQTNQSVYVMGDFALIEPEMNPVLKSIADAGWTTTGVHNHMILESPKATFMHWETSGDLNTVVTQIKETLALTSIQGNR